MGFSFLTIWVSDGNEVPRRRDRDVQGRKAALRLWVQVGSGKPPIIWSLRTRALFLLY